MKHTWLFAVLWNIVAIPTGVVTWQQGIPGSDPRALVGFHFPLIGVWQLGWAAHQTVLWRIFGAPVLQLATMPGVVGGPLRATLEASRGLAGASGVTRTLSCIHHRTTGFGIGRSARETVLLQERRSGVHGYAAARFSIPVAFVIPFECRQTTLDNTDDRILWRLDIDTPAITTIRTTIRMQTGQTPYYDLEIVATNGCRITAGSAIRDKQQAEQLAADLRRWIRVGTSTTAPASPGVLDPTGPSSAA